MGGDSTDGRALAAVAADGAPADDPPEGFVALRGTSGFLANFGQLYVHPARRAVGIRIGPQHLNPLGIPHGGMLATLADTAIGMMMSLETGSKRPTAVTANLSLDFFDSARVGDWVEAHVSFDKLGNRLRFGSCRLLAGERCLLRATAIFSVLQPRT
ncbi:esterase [Cupriavidus sp. USMAA2-4]|uniref:Acyl-coenzyme A thioesterase THEM4 n=1 Tax=Cupriavidus malaysiensis TaxID=367825 RepID=A0ABM6FAX3_9BURK|nr:MULTISPECIES: PaaI family thioesterase [Cupriavidus]AOY95697.1 esterase [Cupriavidus sp. USMAA2-4]AOZ01430.1 esterase [Cupriavidus sp. USMAHM13]AOZ08847.1 esterase [Cupriavidus malaysiensis]